MVYSPFSPQEIVAFTPAEIQQILDGPSAMPPLGVEFNPTDPANWNSSVTSTLTTCFIFSTIAVAIRCYTKLRILKQFNLEDYALILGWMFAIAEFSVILIAHNHGHGVHQWNLSVREFERLLYWVYIDTVIYNPSIFFTKLSILLLYHRVFVPTREGNWFMFLGIWGLVLANFFCYIIDEFFQIFICSPREKIWNVLFIGAHCFNQDASICALGIFNVVSDFAILILPLFSVWKLQMPLKRKIGLTAVFATGLLACTMSIARTIYSFRVVNSSDVSWDVSATGCFTSAEVAISIICASLPVFPKFFQTVKGKWRARLSPTSMTLRTSKFARPSVIHSHNKVKRPWNDDVALHNYYNFEDGSEVAANTGFDAISSISSAV